MTTPTWQVFEYQFSAPAPEGYLSAPPIATFTLGEVTLTREAFWLRDDQWAVRFAATQAGAWSWHIRCGDDVLADGTLDASDPVTDDPHPARVHGFLRPADDARTMVHCDGTSHLMVADTAWALPWRATADQVRDYAEHRQQQGFNAALLMVVQPDMRAEGPDARDTDLGFRVGFRDLPNGHLADPDPDYFDELDELLGVLLDHGITPVLQPVFFGFGWKGLDVAGPVVPPEDYARFCRYLVARYGASPVVYLVGGDGSGLEPQVEAGGRAVHDADCYGQPTGIHYRPHSTADAHQAADWLDFQWCQTGHEGEHVPERVTGMTRNLPTRAVMNGEPSYENSGVIGKATGWWQGHEAWSNLCAGATMGVAYGAGSLWQWRLSADEPGHSQYFTAPGCGWREALQFEGAAHVGLVGRVLSGLPTAGLRPCWDVSLSPRGLLDPGVLYVSYLEFGSMVMFLAADGRVPKQYRLVDPLTGAVLGRGERPADRAGVIQPDHPGPVVLICHDDGWPSHLA